MMFRFFITGSAAKKKRPMLRKRGRNGEKREKWGESANACADWFACPCTSKALLDELGDLALARSPQARHLAAQRDGLAVTR